MTGKIHPFADALAKQTEEFNEIERSTRKTTQDLSSTALAPCFTELYRVREIQLFSSLNPTHKHSIWLREAMLFRTRPDMEKAIKALYADIFSKLTSMYVTIRFSPPDDPHSSYYFTQELF